MPQQTHVALNGSRRPAKAGARRLRRVNRNERIELTVTLKGPELPEIDPTVPPLTAADYAARFAVDPHTVSHVERVLRSFGLVVDGVTPDGRSVRVSGTAAHVQDAFPANLGMYESHDQGEFRGREGIIEIPAELDGIIESVFGLDERQVAHRHRAGVSRLATPMLAPQTPGDLMLRYCFPEGEGEGQTIGIAEFSQPSTAAGPFTPAYFPDDVNAFCQKFNIPLPQVTVAPIRVAPLSPDQFKLLRGSRLKRSRDATVEVMLDVEIVAALCPRANILVFFSTFDEKGWVDLLDAVVSGAYGQLASLSISWGMTEDDPDWSRGALETINRRLHAAALQGITTCASAGDDGSGDSETDGRAHVDFPASSPYVLAVGGTMLVHKQGNVDEVAWWTSPGYRDGGGGATGGGVSTVFPRPPWQNVRVPSINPRSIDGRVVPDVAALAGPPFFDLMFRGRDHPNGGTSCSAPMWAALMARIYAHVGSEKRRFLPAWLYHDDAAGTPNGKSVCRDIVKGQNASKPDPGHGYEAGPGYDAVTGWGVPDGKAIAAAL